MTVFILSRIARHGITDKEGPDAQRASGPSRMHAKHNEQCAVTNPQGRLESDCRQD